MKQIRRDLKRCGIYMIVNLINSKKYIGSSKDIQQRLQSHRAILRNNHHYNQHLQRAWNKYSESNFDYTILEFCSPEDRIKREQYYVDTLKPEYNISKDVVELPPYTEESNRKHSETRKRRMASGEILKTHNTPIYVYKNDGSFVGKWESVRSASQDLHIGKNTIWRVLNGTCVQGKGYKFFKEEQKSVAPFRKPSNKGKIDLRKVYVVSNDEETLEFKGMKEMSEYFHMPIASLRQYVNSTLKLKRKYKVTIKCRVVE